MDPVDPAELAARLSRSFDGAPVTGLRPLAGGASSLTYTAEVGDGEQVVIKLAPPGLRPVGNRDVLRQSRVLKHLRRTSGVPVPEVIAEDPGRPPAVPPYFVTRFVRGESVEPLHDELPPRHVPELLHARARAAIEVLAAMQCSADVSAVDERPVELREEIERWAKAFATVPRFAAMGEACAARLAGGVPHDGRPVLVHGDFRLGNMLADGTRIRAVVDWEVWSLGDHRLDLAWFLNMTDPAHPGAADRPELVPSPDSLLAAYTAHTSTEPAHMEWFLSLVRFRQAAMSALIGKHARKAPEPDPRALEIEGWVEPLLDDVLAAAA